MIKLPAKTEEIAKKYNADIEHAKEVVKYSKMIFSAINETVDKFTPREEEYLINSAILHDIGYSIEKKSHHKHSMELILKEKLEDFSTEEILIIANIARYHRASLPDPKSHEKFAMLSPEKQELVTKLASILRLADGFDKPHKNLILRMSLENKENEIVFHLKSIGFKPSLKSAEVKKELMEHAYGKKITFVIE